MRHVQSYSSMHFSGTEALQIILCYLLKFYQIYLSNVSFLLIQDIQLKIVILKKVGAYLLFIIITYRPTLRLSNFQIKVQKDMVGFLGAYGEYTNLATDYMGGSALSSPLTILTPSHVSSDIVKTHDNSI